jgi:hypothetical protein
MAEASGDTKWTPPYSAFRTILNLVERTEKGAAPPRIDRSFLSGSEGGKTQTLSALKSLGLIGKQGEVTPKLTTLVKNPANRPDLFRALLESHYPDQIALSGVHATQRQLEESFKKNELVGDTRRKAIAFYLHAAKYAHLPLSPNFKAPRLRGNAVGARRRTAPRIKEGEGNGVADQPKTPGGTGDDLRKRYIDMLMKKAEASEQLDDKLLDRIEALLGYEGAGQDKEEEEEGK